MLSQTLDSLQVAVRDLRADIKLHMDSVRSELAASITSLQALLTSHETWKLRISLASVSPSFAPLWANFKLRWGAYEPNMKTFRVATGVIICDWLGLRSRQPTHFVSQFLKDLLNVEEAPGQSPQIAKSETKFIIIFKFTSRTKCQWFLLKSLTQRKGLGNMFICFLAET